MNLKTKQTLSVIFAIGSAVGTATTVWLTRKAALKEQYVNENNIIPFKDKKDAFKKIAPLYIPAAIAGAVTIGSIIGSSVMSHKAQVSLISMATFADQGWRRYKGQIKETLGLDKHQEIVTEMAKEDLKEVKSKDISDEQELYYDEYVGYFKARPEDVAYAYASVNEFFNSTAYVRGGDNGCLSIGDFLRFAKADLMGATNSTESLHKWGWEIDYLLESFENPWINMNITDETTTDDIEPAMTFKVITWVQDPVLLDFIMEQKFEDSKERD